MRGFNMSMKAPKSKNDSKKTPNDKAAEKGANISDVQAVRDMIDEGLAELRAGKQVNADDAFARIRAYIRRRASRKEHFPG